MRLFTSIFLAFACLILVAASAAQAQPQSKSSSAVMKRILQKAQIARPPYSVSVALCVVLAAAPLSIMAIMVLIPQLMEVPSEGLGSVKREDFLTASQPFSGPSGAVTQASRQAVQNVGFASRGKLSITRSKAKTRRASRPTPLMFRPAAAV